MTKYYRVCSQEQWDWLVNRFGQSETQWPEQGMTFEEIHECLASGGFVIVHNDYLPSMGSVFYTAVPQNNGNVIEVSDLMEDEKMKYVTIKGEDLEKVHWETNYGHTSFINHDENGEKYAHEQYLPANLSIPKFLIQQQKVKMTEEEKNEFDKLKDEMSLDRHDLDDLLTRIKDSEDFPLLYHRLYVADGDGVESQLEFARAWADPSLIEAIPEKRWNVKVPPFSRTNQYYYKCGMELDWSISIHNEDEDQQFTESELKEYGLDDDMYEKVEVKE